MNVNYKKAQHGVIVRVGQKCGHKYYECSRFAKNKKAAYKAAVSGLLGAMQ